jgi:hypothetical protein
LERGEDGWGGSEDIDAFRGTDSEGSGHGGGEDERRAVDTLEGNKYQDDSRYNKWIAYLMVDDYL